MLNEQEFLEKFFGQDNGYSLDLIQNDTSNQNKTKPWVDRLIQKKETVLPLLFQGKVYWFGIATTDEQFHRLGEDLSNFIGRTYSNFIPLRAKLVNHPIDHAVQEYTNGRYFRFQGNGNNKIIFEKLEYLRNMWEVRPPIDKQQTTSVGRLLREFYLTVTSGRGHRQKAEKIIEELQARKMLNAVNILFLQIKMLAEFKEWDEILSLRSFSDLINMRRPFAVTEALLQAIYNKELKSKEDHIEDFISTFKNNVYANYGALISNSGKVRSSEVLILLMLQAVTIKEDVTVVNELLKVDTDSHTKRFLKEISLQLTKKTEFIEAEVENINMVHLSILKGKFDYALKILKNLELSWDTTMLLFQCAYQLQTLEAKEVALKAYQELSQEEKEAFILIRQNKEYLEEITDGHSAEHMIIPHDWLSWLENLEHYKPMKNFYLAGEGVNEWTITNMLNPDFPMDYFIDQLYACYDNEHKKESLYLSFPHILTFFQNDNEWPRRVFHKVYFTLLEMLALNEEKGEIELSLIQRLMEALLQIGVNEEKYIEVLNLWKQTWLETASYNYLENGMSVLETLLDYPCPAEEARLELFLDFSNSIHAFVKKLNQNERKVLHCLYIDFGQDETWANIEEHFKQEQTVEENGDSWDLLSGKTIGIYSLMESVSQRVRDIIKVNNSKIKVIINNDKSGSESLKNMVKSSDILLVATASAKHAATIFIEQHKNENTLYLRPEGKGSSSMLNILEKNISELKTGQLAGRT